MSRDIGGPSPEALGIEVRSDAPHSRELLGQLNPETVKDKDGIARTIFTFQNKRGRPVRVLFYEREDLPMVDEVIKKGNVFVFGEQPKRRKSDEWEVFVGQVRQHGVAGQEAVNPGVIQSEVVDEGKSIFFVEHNPRALIDMALVLGASDRELRETRLLLEKGETNERIEMIMDQVIAAKLLDDQGEFKQSADYEGEVLLLRALTGDKNAEAILEKKRQQLEDQDRARREESLRKEREALAQGERTTKPLDPDELVAVHMTNWMPRASRGKNAWELQTTYEATGGKEPRITQHFTMNHPVVSAGLYGSWEDTPIAVITPFPKLVEQNGKPSVLNTIDTFWERSPRRRMTISKEDAFLVKPGEVREGGLSKKDGCVITYKDRNLTPQDVEWVAAEIGKNEVGELQKKFLKALGGAFTEYSEEKSRMVPKVADAAFRKLTVALGAKPGGEHPEWIFDTQMHSVIGAKAKDMVAELARKSMHTWVEDLLDEAGVKEEVPPAVVNEAVKQLEGALVFYIKDLTVKQQIREMGYKVHGGGMWAWDGDSWEATAKTRELGVQMGIPVIPHSAHPSHGYEKILFDKLAELEAGETTPFKFRSAMQTLTQPKNLAKLSSPMRRVLYEVGAL